MVQTLDRLVPLIDAIQSSEVTTQFSVYRAYTQRPGPIVCLVSATGRGKSELLSRIVGSADLSANVNRFAAAEPKLVDQIGRAYVYVQPGIETERGEEYISGVAQDNSRSSSLLLIEAPSLDISANSVKVADCVAAADVILMVVQLTQPTGYDEVTFAKRHLCPDVMGRRAAVLVLTKADLVDDEDFAEASEAIWAAYRDIDWQQVVISGRGINGESVFDLPVFENWWLAQGERAAQQARIEQIEYQEHCLIGGVEQSLRQRKEETNRVVAELQRQSTFRTRFQEVLATRDRIHGWLTEAPKRAEHEYAALIPGLRTSLRGEIEHVIREAEEGRSTDHLDARFGAMCIHWDKEARAQVRQAMADETAEIQSACASFVQAVAELCVQNADGDEEMNSPRASFGADEITFASPRLTLTMDERSNARFASSAAGMGGAMAVGLLGIPIAWPVIAIALPIKLVVQKRMERNRLAALCREARETLETQAIRVEEELQNRFRNDWNELVYHLESQIAPHESALNRTMFAQHGIQNHDADSIATLLKRQLEMDTLLGELDAIRRDAERQEDTDDSSS